MHRRIPRFLQFTGLTVRYGFLFLAAILLICCIAFIYSYRYSRALLIEGAQKDAGLLTRETIARIENDLQPAELLPITLANALESRNITNEDVIQISGALVSRDPVIFGSCLAFEPFTFDKKSYWSVGE